jgi:tRNA (guanine-N7-)-methyltransferase
MSDEPNTTQDTLDLRTFGRRRGRKPSPRQSHLMQNVLPTVRIDTEAWTPSIQHWLEIGFGGGEHLIWQAENNPNIILFGCEPFEDGVIKVLSVIEEGGLSNIRLHPDDARDILRSLPAASIDRTFILFPDPWPKRKHVKRRLINPRLLEDLARIMKPGAELRIGTDIADYARTILMAFANEPQFVWAATGPDDWRIRPKDWPETRYEAKALREGRPRIFLRFNRA